jgi:CRISPR-associated endonuclease Csn1
MTTKKVLGLDLGTNSIGWAVVNNGEEQKSIFCAGSRIIPMDAALQGDFESGNSISQTADRTKARGVRRLFERRALRRERLNRVLNIMGFLPEHYAKHLNRYGQLNRGVEPKLAWEAQDGKSNFLFQSSFNEMTAEFASLHPELLAASKKIPYDWTIYYLRKKALTQAITKQELAWILHQFNQKRGYYQARGEEDETETNKKKEWLTLKVISVRDTGEVSKGRTWYEVTLENGWIYKRQSAYPLDWEGKTRDFIVTTTLNTDGTEAKDASGNIKRTLSAPKEDD